MPVGLYSVQAPTHRGRPRESLVNFGLRFFKRRKVMDKRISQILSMLTIEEKRQLNEMLKALEQKRQPLTTLRE